jgi:hypothetical protein
MDISQNTDHITKTISPDNNIYYFQNDIDVRICPKNAMSTIKNAAHLINKIDEEKNFALSRVHAVRKLSCRINPPFRKGTTKYAIKRDPCERFLSAWRFLKMHHGLEMTVTETVKALETQNYSYEPHFMSQSYFMGWPEEYDKVFNIDDTQNLLKILVKGAPVDVPEDIITNLHVNETRSKAHLGGTELTENQKIRVMELYKIDYERGWYV